MNSEEKGKLSAALTVADNRVINSDFGKPYQTLDRARGGRDSVTKLCNSIRARTRQGITIQIGCDDQATQDRVKLV